MKKLMFACLMSVGGICAVQAATVTDAAMSTSVNISFKCDDTACTGPVKGKVTASETLTISALEEADLQSDTSVTVVASSLVFPAVIPLILSEDPNFQNGDTSAKIKKTIPVEDGVDLIISAQMKWGDGQFDIKVNGKLVGEASTGGIPIVPKKESKDAPELPLVVDVVRGVTPVFSTVTPLIGDLKILEAEQFKSTGEGTEKISVSFKSRGLAPAP